MIYLDYSANTPTDKCVLERFCTVTQQYTGNANSRHQAGLESLALQNQISSHIAAMLNVSPDEIIYTSGASESNNLAIKGIARTQRHIGKHIITTPLEHPSVSAVLTNLQEQGYEIDVVKSDIEALKSGIQYNAPMDKPIPVKLAEMEAQIEGKRLVVTRVMEDAAKGLNEIVNF